MVEHYEYSSSTMLSGLSAKYINIPSSIILDKTMDAKRVAVFSYLSIRKGLDDCLDFSVPSIVTWSGNKPDTRSDGISKKFLDIVVSLKDMGYLTYSNELTKVAYTTGVFNSEKVYKMCQEESFAVIYLDELYTILNYKKENNKDAFFNNAVLLLVFAFFRNVIYRRLNKLKPEERNVNGCSNHDVDVAARRASCPEAYDDTYSEISKKLGISARVVSKAVDVLKQLELIATDEAYHVRNQDGKYQTQNIIFANAYKREGTTLLDSGESYYRNEIENKAELIKKRNKNYIIDKRKRKTMKGE